MLALEGHFSDELSLLPFYCDSIISKLIFSWESAICQSDYSIESILVISLIYCSIVGGADPIEYFWVLFNWTGSWSISLILTFSFNEIYWRICKSTLLIVVEDGGDIKF